MKVMILIEEPKQETRIVPAEQLRTITQYAKEYKKEDGTIGCSVPYIKNLVDLGKLDIVEIAGSKFIIVPETA
jgi:hypothetical protein